MLIFLMVYIKVRHRHIKPTITCNMSYIAPPTSFFFSFGSASELGLVKLLVSFYTNMHRLEFKKKPVQSYNIPNRWRIYKNLKYGHWDRKRNYALSLLKSSYPAYMSTMLKCYIRPIWVRILINHRFEERE